MNTSPASEKQINYLNSLIAQAIEDLESHLNRYAKDRSIEGEKSRTTEARFAAELAFWALMDVEAAGLTVSEASDLIDLVKKGMKIVTLMGFQESSFVALMNSDQMTPLMEKILASMVEGVEEISTETESETETSLPEYEYAADLNADETLMAIVRLMDDTALRLDQDKAAQSEWDAVNRLYREYRGTAYFDARRWCAAVYVVDGKETTPYRYDGIIPTTAQLIGHYSNSLEWIPAHE